jgi:hypothetical protein
VKEGDFVLGSSGKSKISDAYRQKLVDAFKNSGGKGDFSASIVEVLRIEYEDNLKVSTINGTMGYFTDNNLLKSHVEKFNEIAKKDPRFKINDEHKVKLLADINDLHKKYTANSNILRALRRNA